jgi:hypothetical protein
MESSNSDRLLKPKTIIYYGRRVPGKSLFNPNKGRSLDGVFGGRRSKWHQEMGLSTLSFPME